MAGVLSYDLKIRIVRSVNDDELSQADTARRFDVSESTVSRTMAAYRERGTVKAVDYVHGPSPKLGDDHLEWLRKRLAKEPFLSTYELTPLFREAFPGVAVHRSTILRGLHRLGLSTKKRPRSRPPGSRRS